MDEVLTPDSSRFLAGGRLRAAFCAAPTRPATTSSSCATGWSRPRINGQPWGKTAPAPALPQDVIEKTAAKYQEALDALDGRLIASDPIKKPLP
jgi:phosphoribosylaminoimidazole-succinocarboxamide synthase